MRTRVPHVANPAPPPVPPTLGKRERRRVPSPDELRPLRPEDLFASFEDIDIRPMPGGCLVSMAPKGTRRPPSY